MMLTPRGGSDMDEMNATANSEPQKLAEPPEVAEPQQVAEPQATSAEPGENSSP